MAWTTRPRTGVLIDEDGAERGYTVFGKGGAVNLLDPEGRIVHRWIHDELGGRSRVLPNGNLLAMLNSPEDAGGAEKIGGSARGVIEMDWDGNTLWEHRDPLLHHEAARTADGRTLVIGWEELPGGLADQIQGGVPDPGGEPLRWGDVVHEIDADGAVVSTWRSWEHLDPAIDVLCPLDSRKEWTHCNNIEVMPDGRWLLSFRLTSTLAIVDPETGNIDWRWKGETSHQHDAKPLDNGHILLFDNGCHRPGMPSFSRVIEFDPVSEEIIWTHHADVVLSMYSYMGSGADRLPGGNTLITECATGRILEVTHDQQVVWEYVCPFQTVNPMFGPTPSITNAQRLLPDDPRLVDRTLDPRRYGVNERLTSGDRLPIDDLGLDD